MGGAATKSPELKLGPSKGAGVRFLERREAQAPVKEAAEGWGGGENVGRLGLQGLVEIRPLATQGHWVSPSKERTDHSRWPRLEHSRGCEQHGQPA